MPRVFDCFLFMNELDLLEIRLNELAAVVDIFAIVEAPVTFQNRPKPLYFHENRSRFAAFADRIRHVVVGQMPDGATEADHWRREHRQRNSLVDALADASPDDLILLSDADEIPRAGSVGAIAERRDPWPTVHCFELTMFKYFLNHRCKDPWIRNGPRMIRRRHLVSPQSLRNVRPPTSSPLESAWRWLRASAYMRRPIRRQIHKDAGWHFSWMGGVEAVAEKIGSFAHIVDERRRDPEADLIEAAAARISGVTAHESLRRVPIDDSFPLYLRQHQDRFRHLIADVET